MAAAIRKALIGNENRNIVSNIPGSQDTKEENQEWVVNQVDRKGPVRDIAKAFHSAARSRNRDPIHHQ